jgi:hypothetical protein
MMTRKPERSDMNKKNKDKVSLKKCSPIIYLP